MTKIPQHITDAIFSRVQRDLAPGEMAVFAKTGAAVLTGGLLSLLLCAQFGIGFTGFAVDLSHAVHMRTNTFVCALFCGAVFSVLPVLALRLMSSAMQFRYIIRKKWQAPVLWLTSVGALFSYHGNFGDEFVNFIGWTAAAWAVYRFSGALVDHGSAWVRRLATPAV